MIPPAFLRSLPGADVVQRLKRQVRLAVTDPRLVAVDPGADAEHAVEPPPGTDSAGDSPRAEDREHRRPRGGNVLVCWLLLLALVAPSALGDSAEAGRLAKGRALLEEIRAKLERAATAAPPATCTLSAAEFRSHRAHGKKPYDYIRSVSLRNCLVEYGLRYWMNTGERGGADPTAIEGSSGLGMDRPSNANWYSNNFFEFRYGDKQILKTALADFAVLAAEGDEVKVRVRWDTPDADVVLDISLRRDARHLTAHCTTRAKGVPQAVTLGFRAYPGRTRRPRARRAATVQRELSAPKVLPLPPVETALVLFDEHEPRSACGIAFGEAKHKGAKLALGEYGVTLSLRYEAAQVVESGPVRLWDFRDTALNRAMQTVLAQ